MRPTFSDAVAETRNSFLLLVKNNSAMFYEVYAETPSSSLEEVFDEALPEESFLRFNILEHSDDARRRFCELSFLERRAYGFSIETQEKPLPYFASFVPPFGPIGMAWTSDEVLDLIKVTRREEILAKAAAEILRLSKEKGKETDM